MLYHNLLKKISLIIFVHFLALAAQDSIGFAKTGGIYLGLGLMGSGNFKQDMTAFLGGNTSGGGEWINISIAYSGRIYKGLYIVPEFILSHVSIKTVLQGFEATPNESSVALYQYGGGFRYYPINFIGKSIAFPIYVQISLRGFTGSSDVNGFPVDADGLAKELKIGLECVKMESNPHFRVGLEMGYANLPVKPPIDPQYVANFYTPTTARGGEYGGIFISLILSYWW